MSRRSAPVFGPSSAPRALCATEPKALRRLWRLIAPRGCPSGSSVVRSTTLLSGGRYVGSVLVRTEPPHPTGGGTQGPHVVCSRYENTRSVYLPPPGGTPWALAQYPSASADVYKKRNVEGKDNKEHPTMRLAKQDRVVEGVWGRLPPITKNKRSEGRKERTRKERRQAEDQNRRGTKGDQNSRGGRRGVRLSLFCELLAKDGTELGPNRMLIVRLGPNLDSQSGPSSFSFHHLRFLVLQIRARTTLLRVIVNPISRREHMPKALSKNKLKN